jgi:hypothetical protein
MNVWERRCLPAGAFFAGVAMLGACSSVEDLFGVDTGRVQLSCSGSGPLAGTPPLQDTMKTLAPGTQVEIRRPAPDQAVVLTLPAAAIGDVFGYDWKEASAGPGRPPGVWLCRVGWQYDGMLWRLDHLSAQWIGGVSESS